MAQKTYKALTNVTIAGSLREKGDTFEADSKSAHIVTALHFKQIAEDKAPAKQSEKQSEPTAKAEDKAPAK